MSSEGDNRLVWAGQQGHYEVWYATLTHRASQTGFWIRYTMAAPLPEHGATYAQLWFARFSHSRPTQTFGINRRVPIADFHADRQPFRVAIGESELRHDGVQGSLEGGGHRAQWKLEWRPALETRLQLPSVAYRGSWSGTKFLTPNPDIALRGAIEVDGERYVFDGDPAAQSHVWGRKHAYSWAWSHCNAFASGDASIESLSVRLKRGSMILPTLTVCTLRLDGELIEFRQPWQLPLARSDFRTGSYRYWAISANHRVEASFQCRPDDMILAEYLDPDGDPAFCHHTCVADAELTVWRRSPFIGRWREHRRLSAKQSAHFEWVGRAGDATRVKKIHAAV